MLIDSTVSSLAAHGVAYAPAIARAAQRHGLDPKLLAAVAAQETGGPGSNAGHNEIGDGGHGHGLFQIDDRSHPFATTPAAMNPDQNADYAAGMISGLLGRYGGNMHEALSAYNSGSPTAVGTTTAWGDGSNLGYADSVMRHYAQIAAPATPAGASPASASSDLSGSGGPGSLQEEAIAEMSTLFGSIGALSAQAQSLPSPPARPNSQPQSYHRATTDYSSLIGDDAAAS